MTRYGLVITRLSLLPVLGSEDILPDGNGVVVECCAGIGAELLIQVITKLRGSGGEPQTLRVTIMSERSKWKYVERDGNPTEAYSEWQVAVMGVAPSGQLCPRVTNAFWNGRIFRVYGKVYAYRQLQEPPPLEPEGEQT